jgi:hypothetical protein
MHAGRVALTAPVEVRRGSLPTDDSPFQSLGRARVRGDRMFSLGGGLIEKRSPLQGGAVHCVAWARNREHGAA